MKNVSFRGDVLQDEKLAVVVYVNVEVAKNQDFFTVIYNQLRQLTAEHLGKRFNKLRYNEGIRTAEDDERAQVDQLEKDLQDIATQTIGYLESVDSIDTSKKVLIHFHFKDPKTISPFDGAADLTKQKLVNNSYWVEEFYFTFKEASGQEHVVKDDDIRHIAKRICGAFLEYKKIAHTGGGCEADSNGCNSNEIGLPSQVSFSTAQSFSELIQPKAHNSYIRKIYDVSDAIDIVCGELDGATHIFPPPTSDLLSIVGENGASDGDLLETTRYKFPYGIWFRGQARVCYKLKPSLFRDLGSHDVATKPLHKNCRNQRFGAYFDETSMITQFMARLPEHKHDHHTMLEWLCLMQHYTVPTRILDWTENILTALYFAVSEKDIDCDGVLYALNAARLNAVSRVSSAGKYICLPESTDVILRTAMALSHTTYELYRVLQKWGVFDGIWDTLDDTLRDWLCSKRDINNPSAGQSRPMLAHKLSYPVAVFPNRMNARMLAQLSVVTVHGGKSYDPEIESNFPSNHCFFPSIGLAELNDEVTEPNKKFLEVFIVPSCSKRKIREQLKRIGFHDASMFPDVEKQAQFITKQWKIPQNGQ